MEVVSAEAEKLKRLIKEWWEHKDQELEATFGGKAGIDSTTFLAVCKRLREKGFAAVPQEDKLNVIVSKQTGANSSKNIRFTLSGLGQIQQYCRDNVMDGKPFEAMVKDITAVEAQMDFLEYGVRVKNRREMALAADDPSVMDMMKSWAVEKKSFRLIRRWSFEGEGVRFDLSMVRSSQSVGGKYKQTKTFLEAGVFQSPPKYEVEVELLREGTDNEAIAMRNLVRGIGEILRGIQKNTLLIRNSQRERVLGAYKELTKSDRFRGVQPKTLVRQNMVSEVLPTIPNIRGGYNVTDKADGLRCHGYCDPDGEFFLIDMTMNVYRTGLRMKDLANTLLDGEWITQTSEGKPLNQFLYFDIYYWREGENVSEKPFIDAAGNGRMKHMEEWHNKWKEGEGPAIVAGGVTAINKLIVAPKTFLFGAEGDASIFAKAADILAIRQVYHTDGLIFTPNAMGLPKAPGATFAEQFKWKPASENTVDFLVNYEKRLDNMKEDEILTGYDENDNIRRYKTMRLYVGSSRHPAFVDPRSAILMNQPLPTAEEKRRDNYRPALFNPIEYPDTMASICYGVVERDGETDNEYAITELGEPIYDPSIVEMRYDPSREKGWRWIPMRVRHDKTERLLRGAKGRTMNNDAVANDVWNSIHNPVTLHMITTGSDQPLEEELQAITEGTGERTGMVKKPRKKESVSIDPMREFHNGWIKDRILLGTVMRGGEEAKRLVDIGCGPGRDMLKWIAHKAGFVLGVDSNADVIQNPNTGAYKRYMKQLTDATEPGLIPPMVFAIADASKRLVSGDAGATSEEGAILRTLFGNSTVEERVLPYIGTHASALGKKADVVSCMFGIHEFFENAEKLAGFMQNLAEIVKVGGYFVGCGFDGETVFRRLADKGENDVIQAKDESWTVRKRYSAAVIDDTTDSLGLAIEVELGGLDGAQKEFLVPFPLLVKQMERVGLKLLDDQEAAALGLQQSTSMFNVSYKMAMGIGRGKRGGPATKKYAMSNDLQDFSFMNRWYIFKRKSEGPVGDITAEMAAAMDETAKTAIATEEAKIAALSLRAATALKSIPVLEQRAKEALVNRTLAAVPADLQAAAKANAGSPEVSVSAAPKRNSRMSKKALSALEAAAPAPQIEAVGPLGATNTVAVGETGAAPTTGGPGAPVDVPRTVMIEKITVERKFTPKQLFQFFVGAPLGDQLLMGKEYTDARSYLATITPFPITDTMEDGAGGTQEVEYPSVEHYIAAMKFKLASNKPELAVSLFGREGEIHQKYIRERLAQTVGKDALNYDKDILLLKAEMKEIQDYSTKSVLNTKRYNVVFDDAQWAAVKPNVIREGLRQRLERDAKFREIVMKAREKGIYLLNRVESAGSELGGKVKATGAIDGQNKIGVILMDLAGFNF